MKIGRNQPCPCGSGNKYKRCCGKLVDSTLQNPIPPAIAEGVRRAFTIKDLSLSSPRELERILGTEDYLEARELYDEIQESPVRCPIFFGKTEFSTEYHFAVLNRFLEVISTIDIEQNGVLKVSKGFSGLALIVLNSLLNIKEDSIDNPSQRRLGRTINELFIKPKPTVHLKRVVLQSKIWLKDGENHLNHEFDSLEKREIISISDMPFIVLSGELSHIVDRSSLRNPDLLKAILFEFSDGNVFSAGSIFKSPYFWLMQKQFPFSSLIKDSAQLSAFSWGEHLGLLDWQEEISSFSNGIVGKILASLKHQILNAKFDVGVCRFDGDFLFPEKVKEVRSFDFQRLDIDWQIECRPQSLSPHAPNQKDELTETLPNSEIVLTGRIRQDLKSYDEVGLFSALDLSSKRISFFDLGKSIKSVKFLSRKHHTEDLYGFQQKNLSGGELKLRLGQNFDYRSFANDLKKHDIEAKINLVEREIKNQDHFRAYFDEKNPQQVRVIFLASQNGENGDDDVFESAHPIPLTGSYEPLSRILSGISSGLAGYLGSDAKSLASRNRFTRSSELKLYKHSGLFLFILLEYLQFRKTIENETESAWTKAQKTFAHQLNDKLEQVALRILGIANSGYGGMQLADMTGQKFVKKLKSAITELVTQKDFTVVRAKGETVFRIDFSQSLFQFLTVYCDQISSHYQGKTFERGNFPAFETRLIWSQEQPDGTFLSEENLSSFPDNKLILSVEIKREGGLDQLSFLAAAPQHCYISGVPIETLSPEDIQTKFEMVENNRNIDWFELNPQVYFKGEEVPPGQVVDFLKDPVVAYKGRYYYIPRKQIPSLKWLNYFWKKLSHHEEIGGGIKAKNEGIKYQKSEILNMLALKEAGLPVVGGPRWENICSEYDRLGKNEKSYREEIEGSLHNHLQTELKTFQLDGVCWLYQLYRLGLGGILGDDMGLGKTVQTIAFLELLRLRGELGRTLIAVPTSLVYNWLEEIKRFAPQLCPEIYDSRRAHEFNKAWNSNPSASEPQVIICTYGLFADNVQSFNQGKWHIAIFDEAQNLKNIKAKRSLAARELKAEHKFCLSGTPMENHLGEFYSLMDLSVPGALGPYPAFLKTYCSSKKVQIAPEDMDFLRLKVKPLVLRRTKELVLHELPEKTESVIHMDFDPKQEKIYKDIALSWNEKIKDLIDSDGLPKSQLQMLTALLRLRQVCSFPQTVPNVKYHQDPPKLKALIGSLNELIENNHSVVVFTNFVATLELIKQRLEDEGLSVLSFSGKDGVKKRQSILTQFNESDRAQILMMTLKTGGVGLNLTKANYVFHLEPWWNPAAENQASDRVHRMGQTRSVQIYRYIMRNSVEEKIQDLKKIKSEAFSSMFSETEQELSDQTTFSGSSLSKEDFQMLLS